MLQKIKNKIKEHLNKKVSNEEIFALLGLILLGKWFLVSTMIMSAPLVMGLEGITLTPEQSHNISTTIADSFTGVFSDMNRIGLNIQSALARNVILIFLQALPYITFCFLLIVIWATIRLVFQWVQNKIYKRKQNEYDNIDDKMGVVMLIIAMGTIISVLEQLKIKAEAKRNERNKRKNK